MTENLSTDDFDGWVTVPDAARALKVSDQTVRRWVRLNKVPSRRNAADWPLIRLKDVPANLLKATKKISERRYPPAPALDAVQTDALAEIAYLRSQLEKALGIIEQLIRRLGDHPINTLPGS